MLTRPAAAGAASLKRPAAALSVAERKRQILSAARDVALASTLSRGAFTSRAYDGMRKVLGDDEAKKAYAIAARTWDAGLVGGFGA